MEVRAYFVAPYSKVSEIFLPSNWAFERCIGGELYQEVFTLAGSSGTRPLITTNSGLSQHCVTKSSLDC